MGIYIPHMDGVYTSSVWVSIKRPIHAVDGRNPTPVDMANIPVFIGFYISQLVQDFFHQQYRPSRTSTLPPGLCATDLARYVVSGKDEPLEATPCEAATERMVLQPARF